MWESIQHPDFLTKNEVREVKDLFNKFSKMLAQEYLGVDKNSIQITEWNDYNHIAYTGGNLLPGKMDYINYTDPDFSMWIHEIKPRLDKDDIFNWLRGLLSRKFDGINRKADFRWVSFFNFNYHFETHCDGMDVLNKEYPRPPSFDDLKPDNWIPADYGKYVYTHQGLINIDCEHPTDGTIIFDQSFPWSTYIDFSRPSPPVERWPNVGDDREMIIFGKGDSITRFGETIRNFTFDDIPEEQYNLIIEHCDKSELSREALWGLSIDKILYFGQPGTLISWDTDKYHRVKPFPIEEKRRRLCIQYDCRMRI